MADYNTQQRIDAVKDYQNRKADGFTQKQAAEKHGVSKRNFEKWCAKYKHAEAADEFVPFGQELKGVSTLYKDGEEVIKWVKTNKSAEETAIKIKAIAKSLQKEIVPLPPAKETPQECSNDLMACYVLSDFHLGLFAHAEEGGTEWSTDIAREKLNNWIDKATSMSPDAHTGVLLQLGDFFHSNGMTAATPKSGHILDTDKRFQKIADIGVDGLRRAISRMLEKHVHVHVIMADANHDPDAALWLRLMFSKLYENEPRVTIDTTEHPYYCFEWGKTSIFAHHGDKRNLNNVSEVFAGMYRDVFGRTEYSYGHIGHFHHTAAKENSLMQVQIHPTLAARDAYAARGGYLSQRRAKTIIYSKKYGEVGSIVITPEMI